MRLRQLANNDVVTNPIDYITKAEHARILDSRMASKDHESSGELARRAADADRQLSIRLKTQAAELAEAHAEAMSKLQRRQDAELAERSRHAQAHEQELQQAKRAVALAEEHVQSARDAQQRLQVDLIGAPLAEILSNCHKHHHAMSRQRCWCASQHYADCQSINGTAQSSAVFCALRGALWRWRRQRQKPRTSVRKLRARCSTCSTS